MICEHKSAKLNGSKYCFISRSIQLNSSHLFTTQLNDKAVLFLTIQFSIIHLFALSLNMSLNISLNSSIWPIDRTLSGATTPARVDLGAIAMKGYSAFAKAPALLKPHHQIVLYNFQDFRWGGLTPQQRSSRCIQQPQPIVKSSLMNAYVRNWQLPSTVDLNAFAILT